MVFCVLNASLASIAVLLLSRDFHGIAGTPERARSAALCPDLYNHQSIHRP
jgi:hypothetical protein